jgi:hypothetical protein
LSVYKLEVYYKESNIYTTVILSVKNIITRYCQGELHLLLARKYEMPGSTRISKDSIEEEIYNAFERFNDERRRIAFFLKELDVTPLIIKNYRTIKFSQETLLKAVLFQRIKGIKFYTKLTKYLRRNPAEKYALGFSETPNRTQIGYFINHILDQETNEAITFAVAKINEIAEKYSLYFDHLALKPPKPPKETKESDHRFLREVKTGDVTRIMRRRIIPFMDIKQRPNAIYKKEELVKLLIHIGLKKECAEDGARTYKTDHKLTESPSGRALLYNLKKYPTMNDLQDMFERVFEVVWVIARQSNLIDIKKRVDVAIDFTEWPFYGNRKAMMVIGRDHEKGAPACYKFITITIVEPGDRFTLLALPVSVSGLTSKEALLTRLITYTLKRVKINHVYADKGFCDSQSIKIFDKYHLKYLMPMTRYSKVKELLDITPTPRVINEYPLSSQLVNLIIVENKKKGEFKKLAFATNMNIDEREVGLSEQLSDLYAKRWGIETSYRVKKHAFLAKTTSKNYIVRLFYFLFSVLLYDLWILTDLLIWLSLYVVVGEKHLVTAKLFGSMFISIDPGG